jgi:hypothetical protein
MIVFGAASAPSSYTHVFIQIVYGRSAGKLAAAHAPHAGRPKAR